VPRPTIPEGATVISEGTSIEVVAPAGQRIVSIMAWYGDPDNATRGIDVSSTLTQLASGQTSVVIESSNIYGDPAGGTVKVLIFVVAYENSSTPEPTPQPTPQPSPEPTQNPVIIEPEPQPTEEPVVEPTPIPSEEEPAPTPSPSTEPVEEPTENVVDETPTPEPTETPKPTESELPVTEAEAEAAVDELSAIVPEELTDEQAVVLLAAAEMVLENALEGSAEYEAALDALAVVAQADDPELPAELAAIPGAEQVLEAFNAIGNMGADMSPATREEAEKVVVAGVVAVNAALSASLVINAGTPPVPSAPSAPSGGSSGASSSGSGSARRKE
jgi:outer membrane biosynthesis protein TonB